MDIRHEKRLNRGASKRQNTQVEYHTKMKERQMTKQNTEIYYAFDGDLLSRISLNCVHRVQCRVIHY